MTLFCTCSHIIWLCKTLVFTWFPQIKLKHWIQTDPFCPLAPWLHCKISNKEGQAVCLLLWKAFSHALTSSVHAIKEIDKRHLLRSEREIRILINFLSAKSFFLLSVSNPEHLHQGKILHVKDHLNDHLSYRRKHYQPSTCNTCMLFLGNRANQVIIPYASI